ncbi:UNVERIFIED_ORG: hypothetical protein J2Y77_002969 [Pseudomonas lini]|uniref:hypothetical protein n=1 Tax=Pseudomonas viciae TaxID=2505979 RepID=UPI0021116431|nr:hypothetical protein [Pseudomonas viciae]UZE84772.1 hypothetical protein LOY66_19505 [Pseudomonas viciae]
MEQYWQSLDGYKKKRGWLITPFVDCHHNPKAYQKEQAYVFRKKIRLKRIANTLDCYFDLLPTQQPPDKNQRKQTPSPISGMAFLIINHPKYN